MQPKKLAPKAAITQRDRAGARTGALAGTRVNRLNTEVQEVDV